MSAGKIVLEIDGREIETVAGAMLIEAADAAGIHIPRFCYHRKLSVAANCRMCMVDVEKTAKPLPACATPVYEGMRVSTRSARARAAQKSAMEFLLINHPLDCPVCDQGGECELQDVAMGYGSDVSQFTEGKRVVPDPDLGPLVATDMTRCIHCTRCVRFGEEIAGIRELGATGRGEFMRIGTFIEKSVDSELSGNIIDLCPVGALTAKPSRYQARPWELVQRPAISVHDAIGSHLNLHLRGQQLLRVVPKDNDAINETWIADRDRYSYQALLSGDRLLSPKIREDGVWRDADWSEALQRVSEELRHIAPADVSAWLSPVSTAEELYLAQKYLRGLGVASIDHRFREQDFSDQSGRPLCPSLDLPLVGVEEQDFALVIGSHLRNELPLLAHRLHKAWRKSGKVCELSVLDGQLYFPLAQQIICKPSDLARQLLALAMACGVTLPASIPPGLVAVEMTPQLETIADELKAPARKLIILGHLANHAEDASLLRALASMIARHTESTLAVLPGEANSTAAWICGALPHREAGGGASALVGRTVADMLSAPSKALVTMNVEPERDFARPAAAVRAMAAAEFVVSIHAFATESALAHADVMLPVALAYETSGTWINAEGRWQSVAAAAKAPGEARPGWKLWRVLGNLAGLPGFGFDSSEQVREELKQRLPVDASLNQCVQLQSGYPSYAVSDGLQWIVDAGLYSADALTRRSPALQQTRAAMGAGRVKLSASVAAAAGVAEGDMILLGQGGASVSVVASVDFSLPDDVVVTSLGAVYASGLGETGALLTIGKTGGPL